MSRLGVGALYAVHSEMIKYIENIIKIYKQNKYIFEFVQL